MLRTPLHRPGRPLGLRLAALATLAVLTGLGLQMTAASAAGADTLSVTISNQTPARDVPISITFNSNAASIDTPSDGNGPYLYAVARPAGTACATTYGADTGSQLSGDTVIEGDQVDAGTSTTTVSWYPQTGPYVVCAWLETVDKYSDDNISSSVTRVAAMPQTYTGVDTDTVDLSLAPSAPVQGKSFSVTATGTSTPIDDSGDGPYLYVVERPFQGVACASTYGGDPAMNESGATLIEGVQLTSPGPFSTSATVPVAAPGADIVCAWLETVDKYSDDNVLSSVTTAAKLMGFTPVAPAPIPPACVVPQYHGVTLKTIRARLTAAHCTAGKVKYAKSRTVRKGRVIRLGAKPGKKLASGAKVAITISRGRG